MRLFIRAPLADSVFTQFVFNNHPCFSFLEQLIARATGSSSESVMRILPLFCGALTVGIVAAVIAERYGWVSALAGATILATNPLFVGVSRDVRGYSLVTLCALVSTLAVVGRHESAGRWRWLYVIAVGVGVGTHLFMVWVVVAHVVVVLVRRQRRAEWIFRWVAAAMIGVVPYARLLGDLFGQSSQGKRELSFPSLVARDVFGAPLLRTLAVASVVGVAVWVWRRSAVTIPLAVVSAVAMAAAWSVPAAGSSRYFVWATPATAVAVAVAVEWRRWLLLVVAAAVAASCLLVAGDYTADELGNRLAAPYVEAARRAHKHPCGLGGATETLPVYTGYIPELFDARLLVQCDLVVVINPTTASKLLAQVRPAFDHELRLDALSDGLVLYRDPALIVDARHRG